MTLPSIRGKKSASTVARAGLVRELQEIVRSARVKAFHAVNFSMVAAY